MKIYVVFGQTGEYSDGRDWPVKAFADESKAADLVVQATRRANEIYAAHGGDMSFNYGVQSGENHFDPAMQMDYTGTSYSVCPVDYES